MEHRKFMLYDIIYSRSVFPLRYHGILPLYEVQAVSVLQFEFFYKLNQIIRTPLRIIGLFHYLFRFFNNHA